MSGRQTRSKKAALQASRLPSPPPALRSPPRRRRPAAVQEKKHKNKNKKKNSLAQENAADAAARKKRSAARKIVRALRTVVQKKKKKAAEENRARAEAIMRRAARRFKHKAQEVVRGLVVPKSLRSSRPWSPRAWSAHESSSPGEMELHNYLEFSKIQNELGKTVHANLRDMIQGDIDMSNASDVLAELKEKAELFKMYKVRVQRGQGVGSGWELKGLNAAEVGRILNKALGRLGLTKNSAALTYEMVSVSLARGLAEVEKLRQKAVDQNRYTFYVRAEVRRQSGGLGVGGLANRTVAQGRRMKKVVGVGELEPYRLPKDLGKWLEAKGFAYNPQFNPRIRRKKEYCSGRVGPGRKRKCIRVPRPRFVWGYNFGLDASKAGYVLRWITDNHLISHIDPRRKWRFIWKDVLEFKINEAASSTSLSSSNLTEASKLIDNLLRSSLTNHHGYVVYCAFQTASGGGHANVMAIQVLPGKAKNSLRVVARIMDPHAQSSPAHFTDTTRTKLNLILSQSLQKLARSKGVTAEGVDMETCRFSKMMTDALRVQYGLEGVCGPSALALLLSAARESKHAKHAATQGICHPNFCSRVYSHVRIQDAVFVMQLIYRL